MGTTVLATGKLPRMGVLGTLESAPEQAELMAQLALAGSGDALQLDFYDADTLAPELIAALAGCLDRGVRLKIVAYHSLLGHCLLRLGLPVQQFVGPRPSAPQAPYQALALAGSANSLDKMLSIVGHLPLAEVAVFVAQHVAEDQVNLLDQLLQVRTAYRVLMPQHLVPVAPGTIYVAPPGHHMKVAHGLVYLTRDRKIEFARPSIDALFESLAGEYGERALAVLLCGFGQDGVAGCAALKKAGACVIVEDADDCAAARVLPAAARAAGAFDYVLKHAAIASVAAAAVGAAQAEPAGPLLDLFLDALWQQYGYDFRGYQRDSLTRRFKTLMGQFGTPVFCDFQRAVLSDPLLFERLVAEISVGVTGFFRHPEQFQLLREEVLPYLRSFPVIKLWSAGCATGEEAYSLAILLDELGLLEKSRLFATDLNHYLLALAKSALFPLATLDSSRDNYRKSGGQGAFDTHVDIGARYLSLKPRLRKNTLFYRHSLVDSGIFNEFQLIVCRNVLIYFDVDLQKKVLERFARSLHRDGFLLLGPQDGLSHLARLQGFEPHAQGSHLYRLREGFANG